MYTLGYIIGNICNRLIQYYFINMVKIFTWHALKNYNDYDDEDVNSIIIYFSCHKDGRGN